MSQPCGFRWRYGLQNATHYCALPQRHAGPHQCACGRQGAPSATLDAVGSGGRHPRAISSGAGRFHASPTTPTNRPTLIAHRT